MTIKQLIDECNNAINNLKADESSQVRIRLSNGKFLDITECLVYLRTNSRTRFKQLILKTSKDKL